MTDALQCPFAATIVSWNDVDQIGMLRTADGHELKFGASACRFAPSLGQNCWVVETKPDPLGRGLRAKIVNLTGAADVSPEAAAKAKSDARRAEIDAEQVRERARALQPYQLHFDEVRALSDTTMPSLYVRAYADGALGARPERSIALPDEEWVPPHEIVSALRAARAAPLDERELLQRRSVSMNEVERSFHRDIPFAAGSRGWYVFRTDRVHQGELPVFYCEMTGERVGYAPSFEGFLFRSHLELAHERTPEDIARIIPYVRREWIDQLASCTMPVWEGVTPRDADPEHPIDSILVLLPVGTPEPPPDLVEFHEESGDAPVSIRPTFVESSRVGGLGSACAFAVLRYELPPTAPTRLVVVHLLRTAPPGLRSVDADSWTTTFRGEAGLVSTLALAESDAGAR